MDPGYDFFYSGTSGLVLPMPKAAYPAHYRDKSRLTYYASRYNSIEINSSFYKMPMASTVSKWAASVPGVFRFSFKVPRTVSHAKGLLYDVAELEKFMQVVDHAGEKKGALLLQFPPSLKIDHIGRLQVLLQHCYNYDPCGNWKIAVEFRDRSWYHETLYELLRHYNAALVIQDIPASTTPADISTAGFMYLRFHGPGGRYRGSYDDHILEQYALRARSWMTKGMTVYVYFNNTMGDAIANLEALNRLVGENG